jgi:hypothetical protein
MLEKVIRRKKEFNTALHNALNNGLISSFDDVVNIYKGINKLASDDNKYRYGLSNLLRGYIINLVSSSNDDINSGNIRAWKDQLTDYIKKNDELSPYSELPDLERSIMSDIDAFLDQNDIESIKRKLKELANTIQTRKEHTNKLEKSNKWSNLVAIIGVVLTIVFGLLSLL